MNKQSDLKKILTSMISGIVVIGFLFGWYIIAYNNKADTLMIAYQMQFDHIKASDGDKVDDYEKELKELNTLLKDIKKNENKCNYFLQDQNEKVLDLKYSINNKIAKLKITIEKLQQQEETLSLTNDENSSLVSTELNTKQGEQNSYSKDYTAQNSKNTNSSNTVVSSNTGSTSQNSSSTQLPATYIKDGYYVHNGHKIAITSEPTRGTYTFNDPSQSSVWKYQSCILYWC